MGQSGPKDKGKISRMLAAKTSLAARVDALGEETAPTIGIESKAKVRQRSDGCSDDHLKVEARLRVCEQNKLRRISGSGKKKGAKMEKFEFSSR